MQTVHIGEYHVCERKAALSLLLFAVSTAGLLSKWEAVICNL